MYFTTYIAYRYSSLALQASRLTGGIPVAFCTTNCPCQPDYNPLFTLLPVVSNLGYPPSLWQAHLGTGSTEFSHSPSTLFFVADSPYAMSSESNLTITDADSVVLEGNLKTLFKNSTIKCNSK